jgi:hypothetical protein
MDLGKVLLQQVYQDPKVIKDLQELQEREQAM